MLTVGSLFSGIGGFDLGFERAGMRTVWFCEQDAFCQRVLAKHWPGVPCHPDVRALVADARGGGFAQGGPEPVDDETGRSARGNGVASGQGPKWRGLPGVSTGGGGVGETGSVPVPVPYVDVLAGGFPCQDISLAGKGAGIDGSRSGLWREFARLIGELRPRYVVAENVPAITSRGLDRVLADLAACGFDAEWDHLPASAFGAPHRRDRFWLVAYPARDAAAGSQAQAGAERERAWPRDQRSPPNGDGEPQSSLGVLVDGLPAGLDRPWAREPDIPRVAVGVPGRVNQLRALGNALVPQIAQWIGERIVSCEGRAQA